MVLWPFHRKLSPPLAISKRSRARSLYIVLSGFCAALSSISASKSEKMGKSVFFKVVISVSQKILNLLYSSMMLFFKIARCISERLGMYRLKNISRFFRWRAISLMPLPSSLYKGCSSSSSSRGAGLICRGFRRPATLPAAFIQSPFKDIQRSLYSDSGSIKISFVPFIYSAMAKCFTAVDLPTPATPIKTIFELVRSSPRRQVSMITRPPVESRPI